MDQKLNLKWGVLSTGRIARTFAEGVLRSKHGKLVAVGSRSQKDANAFALDFGIARAHGSYEALLADPDVEAVYISPPHPFHAEWAIKAAEANKHILCEKPLTMNHAQAMVVIDAARKHDVFLMEAFMYRCHPQTHKLIELIRSDAIGTVRVIQATFSFQMGFQADHRIYNNALGGGGILDVGCYPVSMSRLIAGAASGKDFLNPIAVSGAGKLNDVTGVDNYAVGVMKFENGIVAQIATGVSVEQENVVRIFGDKGSLLVTAPWLLSIRGGTSDIVLNRNGKREIIEIKTDEWLYGIEADTVAEAIRVGKRQANSPAMSWDDTLGNIRALDAWRAAIGLEYAQEKHDAPEMKQAVGNRAIKTIDERVGGRHSSVNRSISSSEMPYAQLDGIDKPLSRLVMGIDNQENIAHLSAMCDDFVERGGNVFDTAHIYGNGKSEVLLGQWLRNRNIREQLVILDKGAHTPFCTPNDLVSQFRISLERLQLDYVDIYMLHRDNSEVPVGEFVDVLNDLHRASQLRVFGGSNWSAERIDAANEYARSRGLRGMTVLSNNFSLAQMVEPPWTGCISASDSAFRTWLTKTQTPLFAWSSQARGFFLPHVTPDFRSDEEVRRCWFSDDNFERKRRAEELAKKYNVMPINIALAYVLNQQFPTFPLIGPRTIEETRTSMFAFYATLTPDEVSWLNLET
jgi:predicted dehydrogenase/aryl-alcohol dehydrogenase-like predicted oxidoreductase